MIDTEMKQTVWHTMSGGPLTGYYVWDVREAFVKNVQGFIEGRDGMPLAIYCEHFWTKEAAVAELNRAEYWEQLNIIT